MEKIFEDPMLGRNYYDETKDCIYKNVTLDAKYLGLKGNEERLGRSDMWANPELVYYYYDKHIPFGRAPQDNPVQFYDLFKLKVEKGEVREVNDKETEVIIKGYEDLFQYRWDNIKRGDIFHSEMYNFLYDRSLACPNNSYTVEGKYIFRVLGKYDYGDKQFGKFVIVERMYPFQKETKVQKHINYNNFVYMEPGYGFTTDLDPDTMWED